MGLFGPRHFQGPTEALAGLGIDIDGLGLLCRVASVGTLGFGMLSDHSRVLFPHTGTFFTVVPLDPHHDVTCLLKYCRGRSFGCGGRACTQKSLFQKKHCLPLACTPSQAIRPKPNILNPKILHPRKSETSPHQCGCHHSGVVNGRMLITTIHRFPTQLSY